MTVTRHFLHLQRTALLIWGAILALMVLAVAAATPAVTQGADFETLVRSLGPALQNMAGGDITRFPSAVDAYVCLKLLAFLPAMVGVYVVLATSAVVAREQARGTLDFLLSLPVDRAAVLRDRFLGVMLGTGALYLTQWVCLVIGLEAGGVTGSYGRYALALLAAYGVNIAQGGLVLILSLALREHARAVRWGLILVLGAYLFAMTLQAAGVLAPLRTVLLYGLADPFPVVADGRFPWGALLAGAAGSLLGVGWGGRLFARKELQ